MKLSQGKVQRARYRLGLSLEDVAKVCGISKNTVGRAEHEEEIRTLSARKIAGALKVEVADLIKEEAYVEAD